VQAKVAKSSSWRVWLGSWRSSSTGAGRNGKPGSGSLDAAVAAAAAATHPRSPAAQQVSKHPVMTFGASQLLDGYINPHGACHLHGSLVGCQCACNMYLTMCDGSTLQIFGGASLGCDKIGLWLKKEIVLRNTFDETRQSSKLS